MPIELEQPPSDASVQSAEGKISINFNQLNNTIIDGETVPISAIIQSLPEDCRSWGRDYIDKEQQARHELIKIEQRNQFELEKTDKQKEIEELRLSHKSEQFGKICGLICTALFIILLIVCVVCEQLGWGIAAVILAIISSISAFSKAQASNK